MSLKTKLRRSKHGRVTYLDVCEAQIMKQRLSISAGTAEHSISMTNLQNEVDFHEHESQQLFEKSGITISTTTST